MATGRTWMTQTIGEKTCWKKAMMGSTLFTKTRSEAKISPKEMSVSATLVESGVYLYQRSGGVRTVRTARTARAHAFYGAVPHSVPYVCVTGCAVCLCHRVCCMSVPQGVPYVNATCLCYRLCSPKMRAPGFEPSTIVTRHKRGERETVHAIVQGAVRWPPCVH